MFIPKNKEKTNLNILSSDLFKDIFAENSKLIGHTTGFTCFDIPTSYLDTNGVSGLPTLNGGFFPRIYTIYGESETGKTSLLVQVSGSTVDRHPGSNMVFIDAEGNCGPERIKNLNNWNDIEYSSKCLYIPPSPPITINRVYDIIRRIAYSKKNNKGKIELRTPYMNNYTGKFIDIYPPTFVALDSIPSLIIAQSIEEYVNGGDGADYKEVEQISSNVDGMREAKDNTNFLRKVKGLLDEYNIILFLVNHLSKEVAMSMFDRPKKFHPLLAPGEKLKGGNEQIFQSFGMYKISQKEMINDKNPIYGDSIRGYLNQVDIIKNKGNVSGTSFPYIFDRRTGFRFELSDFEYLFQKKVGFSGSPMSTYMTILPEIKFTRKNLVDKCEEFPLLPRAINFTAKYFMANELVLNNKFGEINLEAFAQMPLPWRISIIFSTTQQYPTYSGFNRFLQNQAFNGGLYTGFDEEIDIANIDKIKNVVRLYEKGCCVCKDVRNNDPIKNLGIS